MVRFAGHLPAARDTEPDLMADAQCDAAHGRRTIVMPALIPGFGLKQRKRCAAAYETAVGVLSSMRLARDDALSDARAYARLTRRLGDTLDDDLGSNHQEVDQTPKRWWRKRRPTAGQIAAAASIAASIATLATTLRGCGPF